MRLESKRLVFKKLKMADYEDYKSWFSDDRAMQFIHGKGLKEKSIKKSFFKDLHDNVYHMGLGTFTTHNKETDEFMGICKLAMINEHTSRLEFGIVPKYWKQYYGSEMARSLVKYAQTFGFITKVVADSHPKNKPSHKILIQNRFKKRSRDIDNKDEDLHFSLYIER